MKKSLHVPPNLPQKSHVLIAPIIQTRQALAKYTSRMALAFSQSVPVLRLKKENLLRTHDICVFPFPSLIRGRFPLTMLSFLPMSPRLLAFQYPLALMGEARHQHISL